MRIVLFVLAMAALVATGCKPKKKDGAKDDDKTESVAEAKGADEGDGKKGDAKGEKKSIAGAMPEACKRAGKPGADLGLAPKDFITCFEKVLAVMTLPDEAKKPFKEEKAGVYSIPDYVSVAMKIEGDRIASMDIFFFPNMRDKHGTGPELGAQWAALAIVFPSAKVDPRQGKKIFESIDAIGRKTNKPIIDIDRDGIALTASFMKASVRYRFKPK